MKYQGIFGNYNKLLREGKLEKGKVKEFLEELNKGPSPEDLPTSKVANDLNFIAACLIKERVDKGEINLEKDRLRSGAMLYLKEEGKDMNLQIRQYRRRDSQEIGFLRHRGIYDEEFEFLPTEFAELVSRIIKMFDEKEESFKAEYYEDDPYGSSSYGRGRYGRHSNKKVKTKTLFERKVSCKVWREPQYDDKGEVKEDDFTHIKGECGPNTSSYSSDKFSYRIEMKLKNGDELKVNDDFYLLMPATKKVVWKALERLKKEKAKIMAPIKKMEIDIYKEIDKLGYTKYLLARMI